MQAWLFPETHSVATMPGAAQPVAMHPVHIAVPMTPGTPSRPLVMGQAAITVQPSILPYQDLVAGVPVRSLNLVQDTPGGEGGTRAEGLLADLEEELLNDLLALRTFRKKGTSQSSGRWLGSQVPLVAQGRDRHHGRRAQLLELQAHMADRERREESESEVKSSDRMAYLEDENGQLRRRIDAVQRESEVAADRQARDLSQRRAVLYDLLTELQAPESAADQHKLPLKESPLGEPVEGLQGFEGQDAVENSEFRLQTREADGGDDGPLSATGAGILRPFFVAGEKDLHSARGPFHPVRGRLQEPESERLLAEQAELCKELQEAEARHATATEHWASKTADVSAAAEVRLVRLRAELATAAANTAESEREHEKELRQRRVAEVHVQSELTEALARLDLLRNENVELSQRVQQMQAQLDRDSQEQRRFEEQMAAAKLREGRYLQEVAAMRQEVEKTRQMNV